MELDGDRFGNDTLALRSFWHPVAHVEELVGDGPLQVELLGERWVVARLDGALRAFRDLCSHRLAPLSAGCVVDGTLQCPYHGYRFAGDGTCVEIPALGSERRVPPKAHLDRVGWVEERHGLLWLALEDPIAPIIEIPEWDDPSFDAWHLGARETTVSAGLLMDNFIDAGHFPYLHRATFGADDTGTPQLDAVRDGWRLQVVNRGQPNSGPNYGTVEALQTYVIAAPFSLRIEVQAGDGRINTFLFLIQPIDEHRSRLYPGLAYNDLAGDAEMIATVSAFNDQVIDEDFTILSRYEDTRIPLDLRAEVHTKADLGTIEYRRLAADIVALRAEVHV